MQSPETDRLHMDAKDWSIVCLNCGSTFEAKRSDATFCSTRCRVAHSRKPAQRLAAIEELANMRFRIIQIAEKYKGDAEVLKALEILKSNVASAEYICEFID